MSLIPAIFRVVELSQYSDEEYERLVAKAKLRRGDAIWVIPGFGGGLCGILWIVGCIALVSLARASRTGLPLTIGERVLVAGVLFTGVLIAIAGAMAIRWYLLLGSIRRIVNRAGCPFCEFSLVGLPVEHGWVRCPECGQNVFLHEHKIAPEDMLTDEQRRSPVQGLGAGPMGAYKVREPAPSQKQPTRRSR